MSFHIFENMLYQFVFISALYILLITFVKYLLQKKWCVIEANILSIEKHEEIDEHYLYLGKNGISKSMEIKYKYFFNDVKYIGSKIQVNDDIPIISNYNKKTFYLLENIRDNEEALKIYINPKKTEQSIIFKNVPISVYCKLCFVILLFGLLMLNNGIEFFSGSLSLFFIPFLLMPSVVVERIKFKKNLSESCQ